MTLRFTPRARNDLRDILEYIAKDNPAAADRLRLAFLGAAKLIPCDLVSGFAARKLRNCVAVLSHDTHTAFITVSKMPTFGSSISDTPLDVRGTRKPSFRMRIALFQPDIPQNMARFCATSLAA
jgi:plasmid stabilization system protein ParE